MLSAGLDFFECIDHKGSVAHGDIGKWLAPGTLAAMKLQMTLSVRASTQTNLI